MDITFTDVFVFLCFLSGLILLLRIIARAASSAPVIRHKDILEELKKNIVVLRVDTVDYHGQDVFLVYEALENKFITQDTDTASLVLTLQKKFQDKSVFLKLPNDDLIPFATAKTIAIGEQYEHDYH